MKIFPIPVVALGLLFVITVFGETNAETSPEEQSANLLMCRLDKANEAFRRIEYYGWVEYINDHKRSLRRGDTREEYAQKQDAQLSWNLQYVSSELQRMLNTEFSVQNPEGWLEGRTYVKAARKEMSNLQGFLAAAGAPGTAAREAKANQLYNYIKNANCSAGCNCDLQVSWK